METNTDERLEQALATLNDLIALAREAGLHESAQFLAMAKLNMLIEVNGVTEEEFRALCVALEDEAGAGAGRRARPSAIRVRRGEESGRKRPSRRKPWLAQGSLASLRAARGRIKQ
jgi:hypothetical protein